MSAAIHAGDNRSMKLIIHLITVITLLCCAASAQDWQAKEALDRQLESALVKAGAATLSGKISAVVAEGKGVLIHCVDQSSDLKPVLLNHGKLEVVSYPPVKLPDAIVFLKVPPEMGVLADDDAVSVIGKPTGELYHYASVLGAAKTVRVYEVLTW